MRLVRFLYWQFRLRNEFINAVLTFGIIWLKIRIGVLAWLIPCNFQSKLNSWSPLRKGFHKYIINIIKLNCEIIFPYEHNFLTLCKLFPDPLSRYVIIYFFNLWHDFLTSSENTDFSLIGFCSERYFSQIFSYSVFHEKCFQWGVV